VKFLIDNQLPASLAQYLQKQGFDCRHVLEVGLGEASDAEICQYAEAQERVIVSKDEDFFYVASQPGTKVRLLWVRLGNCRTSVLLEAFERLWPMIESSLKAGDRVVEIR
jgi:predicted nuclease of predicted toxin-antitoxin system